VGVAGLILPLTLTSISLLPTVFCRVPLRLPTAFPALMRTSMVVLASVLLFGVRISDDTQVVPSSESSTPAGAVTTKLPVKPMPLTV
jgi:hypothetical protein